MFEAFDVHNVVIYEVFETPGIPNLVFYEVFVISVGFSVVGFRLGPPTSPYKPQEPAD